MAVTANVFAQAAGHFIRGDIDFLVDTVKALCLTAFTPGTLLTTGDFIDDILAAGTEAPDDAGDDYVTRGVTLASKTVTTTVANSWAVSRANSTAYVAGDVYRPATGNGFLYMCVVAGTSAAAPPTFTTVVGDDFADGTATFVCAGTAITVLDAADPVVTTVSGGSFGPIVAVVFYKDTATNATSPVLSIWQDDAATAASNGGTWTATIPANVGIAYAFTS